MAQSEGLRHKLSNLGGAKVSPTLDNTNDPSTDPSDTKKQVPVRKASKPFKFFFRDGRDDDHHHIVRGIFNSPTQEWIVFLFTFFVGSFLFGGGIYLIVHGADKGIVDLIVVGAMGIVIGSSFSAIGWYGFILGAWSRRKERILVNQEKKEQVMMEEKEAQKAATVVPVTTITVTDLLNKRRPSNVQLYGREALDPSTGKPVAAPSPQPPPLMVPSDDSEDQDKKPVRPVVFSEATRDDIPAISHAAKSKDIPNSKEESKGSNKSQLMESRESSDISVRNSEGHLITHDSDSASPDPVPLEKNTRRAPEVVVTAEDDESTRPPPTPAEKMRVLSASNERRRSAQMEEGDVNVLKDGIPIEPFQYTPPLDDEIKVPVHVDHPEQSET